MATPFTTATFAVGPIGLCVNACRAIAGCAAARIVSPHARTTAPPATQPSSLALNIVRTAPRTFRANIRRMRA